MKKELLVVVALAGAPGAAQAEPQSQTGVTVAEKGSGGGVRLEPDSPAPRKAPPPVDLLSGPNPLLTAKEKQGVRFGKQWAGNRDKPARGRDGGAVYVFGSTLPTIVCAPLYVCDLVLQAGETVKSVNVGDSVRWQITPAEQGTGETAVTHIMIKPTDVGLVTNMVITTDRRAYTIKLLSRETDWMPRVSFEYRDAADARWDSYRARRDREQEARAAAAPAESSGALDFGYRLSGDSPSWRPIRVYSNGAKTYIQFPPEAAHGDLPALVALADDPSFLGLDGLINGPQTQMVNYRLVSNDRFEVDKVLSRAALISGVGPGRVSVEITREGRN